MLFSTPDVASAAKWSAVWESCEYASEALVFFGCVGEYIAEYTDWRTEEIRHSLGRRSLILLILGLGTGLFSLIKTNALAGQIIGSLGEQVQTAGEKAQRASEALGTAISKAAQAETASTSALSNSREAQTSASSALTIAGSARREADSFEKDIVSAKQQASAAESHLADALREATNAENELRTVQGRLADRVFNADQRTRFARALKGKTKFPIKFASPVADEPVRYARQIIPALAGWDIDTEGLGITMLRLDPEVNSAIQARGLLGAPLITFGPTSNKSNVEVLSRAFDAAGVKTVQIQMTKQTTDEIVVIIPEKAP